MGKYSKFVRKCSKIQITLSGVCVEANELMSLKATQHFFKFLKEFGSQFRRNIKGLLFGFRHFSFTINYEETSSWKKSLSDSKKVTFLKSSLSLLATEKSGDNHSARSVLTDESSISNCNEDLIDVERRNPT